MVSPESVWDNRFGTKPVCPTTAELDIEYNELAQSWKRFHDHLPRPDQVDFRPHPQTASDLIALVRTLQTNWKRNARQYIFTRATMLCDRFLATMDSHSVLLSTLSEHEYYASLFYGALQSLLKASAHYHKIMEGLMKALVKVNESICLPVGKRPSDSVLDDMAPKVTRFYSLVFFLFTELMDWYLRRSMCRLLSSPSQEVYSHFQNLVCTIRGRGLDIMRDFTSGLDLDDRGCAKKRRLMHENDSYLWEEARTRQVGLQGPDRHSAARNAIIRHLIWDIQNHTAQRHRTTKDREVMLQWLDENAGYQLPPARDQNNGISCVATTPAQDLDTSRFDWSYGSRRKYTKVELQFASSHLQDFFNSDDQIALFESNDLVIDKNIITSLCEWANGPDSQTLALAGSKSISSPNSVTFISACYARLARQGKLPVISHFCALPSHKREGMTPFEQGLIALAYSLIRQLVDCLPPVVNSDVACQLNSERFRFLEGTLTHWKEVLSLTDQLLSYAPPLLVCIVDGLDAIQDTSTDTYIRSLLRILLAHTRHEAVELPDDKHGQRVLLKVLFTVKGQPASLVETLSEYERNLSESKQVDPALVDTALISDPDVLR